MGDERFDGHLARFEEGTRATKARINRVRNRVHGSIDQEQEAEDTLAKMPGGGPDVVARVRSRIEASQTTPKRRPWILVAAVAATAIGAVVVGRDALVDRPTEVVEKDQPAPAPKVAPPKTVPIEKTSVARRAVERTPADGVASDLMPALIACRSDSDRVDTRKLIMTTDRFGRITRVTSDDASTPRTLIDCVEGVALGRKLELERGVTASAQPETTEHHVTIEVPKK